jgi:hypothetical protein
MLFFDLVGTARKLKALIIVSFYISKARKSHAKVINFLSCPDNNILMIQLDDKLIKHDSNIDLKLLTSIYDIITSKKYRNLSDWNLQKLTYESKNKTKKVYFDLVTIPLH